MSIDRKQLAYDYFKQGYNCAQSVVLSFADILPMDKQTLEKVSIAFGGGFGRTRNLCGAVSAMGIVTGLLSDLNEEIARGKTDVYKTIQALVAQFKDRNGTDNCGELLKNVKNLTDGYVPQVRDAEYYSSRPCVKFVLDSVDILEKTLLGDEK